MYKKLVLGAVMAAPAWFFARLYRIAPYGDALRDWSDSLKELGEDRNVLELGCGPGELSRYMADQGWQVTGFDQSEKMLAAARKLPGDMDFQQGDAVKTGLEAARFDAIISASLLNVLSEPQELIAEMARLLRSGGVISVLFPAPDFNVDLARDFADQKGLTGFEKAAIEVWATAPRKLDPADVEEWFSTAGFRLCQRSGYFLEGVQALTFKRR